MTDVRRPEELATALAEMARDLLAQDSLQQTLDRIVGHAVELVDGCKDAGIMVIHKGVVHTMAASDDKIRASDRIQGELSEGPCFEAVCTGTESYLIPDMQASAASWPRYGPHVQELGIGGMLGFKLFTEDETLGALNLYSSRPGVFSERSEQIGRLLASHAAVAFASARIDADLHNAISSRQEIGMAIGIIMERDKASPEEAFTVLAKASQDRNIKVRELAHRVTETGQAPRIA